MSAETQVTPTETKPTEKELNFEKLRKLLDDEKSKREAAEARATELEKQKQAKPQKDYDDADDDDEPYVDHRKLNRKLASFEEKFEKKVDEMAERKARSLLEQEKQKAYIKANPDFTQVLTEDNISKFAEKHPQIAERMLTMPNTFDRQALLYEQIKALKPQDKPEPSIQEKIDANRRSPFYRPPEMGTAPYNNQGDFSPSGQKNAYQKLQELKNRVRLG